MKRGEIWMVDFGPAMGQVFATTIIVPLTTNLRRLSLPTTLLLNAGEGSLPRDSVVLCYQVQVRGKARIMQRLGELPSERLSEIEAGLLTVLGL